MKMIKLVVIIGLLLFSINSALGALDTFYSSDIIDFTVEHPTRTFYTSDSIQDLELFLAGSDIDEREYVNNTYNCVNFSHDLIDSFTVHGFTAAKTRMHKENGTAITDDMHMIVAVQLGDKIVFVEPQSDTVLRFDDLELYYSDEGFTDIVIYELFGISTVLSFDGWMPDFIKEMFGVETNEG